MRLIFRFLLILI